VVVVIGATAQTAMVVIVIIQHHFDRILAANKA